MFVFLPLLVFTRIVGESFRIGGDVKILIADTNGLAVKLGIEAPKHIKVNRMEVHERIAAVSSQNAKECYPSKPISNSR